ncbi:MAG: thioredoxin family protein [Pseudomonadota bacterium]
MKKIQILGTGCSKCENLAKNAEEAAKNIGIEYEIIKIKDITEITNFGVMITPALAINDVIKTSGKVLTVSEIEELLK